ncbi:MAG: class I SAM-dependent methyltransferase [bacterium]
MNLIVEQAEVERNRAKFMERIGLYRARGLDFLEHREWLLSWAGPFSGKVILEMGCGSGYMTLVMAQAGYRFVSMDRDMEMLYTTALNLADHDLLGDVGLVLADATRTPFAAGSFDLVVAVDFFHHVESTSETLDEIDRVLEPGGEAIISDFDDDGFDVIANVQAAEGRVHPVLGAGRGEVYRILRERGYVLKEERRKYHWSMVAHKP